MYCSKCGAVVTGNYCSVCGTRARRTDEDNYRYWMRLRRQFVSKAWDEDLADAEKYRLKYGADQGRFPKKALAEAVWEAATYIANRGDAEINRGHCPGRIPERTLQVADAVYDYLGDNLIRFLRGEIRV